MWNLVQSWFGSKESTTTGKGTNEVPSTPKLVPTSKILIVGSGCFGVSTALHLLKRGYKDVTIIDRAPTLPAIDAASTDINKIIRSSYEDKFYTDLAREAIECWKDRKTWGENYRESGVLVFGTGVSQYVDSAFQNDLESGARVKKLKNPRPLGESRLTSGNGHAYQPHDTITLEELFHSEIPLGACASESDGFLNADGGWADAEGGVARAMELVQELGGKFVPGKEVSKLKKSGSITKGVSCKDGTEYSADLVILATGSWTASAFPELNLGFRCFATGQSVATVKLTPEEAERYRNIPVLLDFGLSGFYCFPPNKDNLMKFSRHFGGVANFKAIIDAPNIDAKGSNISTPRTYMSDGEDGLKIPKSEALILRERLQEWFPELGKKEFYSTRLCWYTDSPDSDWIIDVHPDDSGLALITSGSGHGYKFLPVIGRLVVDRIEGRMSPEIRRKFAINRSIDETRTYRDGAIITVLNTEELCGPLELKSSSEDVVPRP